MSETPQDIFRKRYATKERHRIANIRGDRDSAISVSEAVSRATGIQNPGLEFAGFADDDAPHVPAAWRPVAVVVGFGADAGLWSTLRFVTRRHDNENVLAYVVGECARCGVPVALEGQVTSPDETGERLIWPVPVEHACRG